MGVGAGLKRGVRQRFEPQLYIYIKLKLSKEKKHFSQAEVQVIRLNFMKN